MKTLIIGGSGFVGTHLLDSIGIKNIINYDKRDSKSYSRITVVGNILDKVKLKKVLKDIETVILLAAEHKDNVSPKQLYYDVNVTGTKNVLEAMNENDVRKIIFTSTVAVYGLNKINLNEDSTIDPFNDYGKSKAEAEKAITNWQKKGEDRKAIIIRPTVIFGERNRGNVYNLMSQIFSKKFIMIGDGENKKSISYVKNVTDFIIYLKDKEFNGLKIYNYVDKPDLSMNELATIIYDKLKINIPKFKIPIFLATNIARGFDMLSSFTKKKYIISYVRVKKFCANTIYSSNKTDILFKPKYDLKKAISKTLDYEFNNRNKD